MKKFNILLFVSTISSFLSVLRHLCQVQLQLREAVPLAGAQADRRPELGVRGHAGSPAARGSDGSAVADEGRAGVQRGPEHGPARRRRGSLNAAHQNFLKKKIFPEYMFCTKKIFKWFFFSR